MVASFIAFFINREVNWGMAAALSALLMLFAAAAVVAARLIAPGAMKGRLSP
jgi:ABC-type spermidine/putrescine transport system permease subunit I